MSSSTPVPRGPEPSSTARATSASTTARPPTAWSGTRRGTRSSSVIDSRQAGVDAGEVLDGDAQRHPGRRRPGRRDRARRPRPRLPHLRRGARRRPPVAARERVVLLDGIARGHAHHQRPARVPQRRRRVRRGRRRCTASRSPTCAGRRTRRTCTCSRGRIFDVTCPRIAVLGTDGAIGKRTTATLLVPGAQRPRHQGRHGRHRPDHLIQGAHVRRRARRRSRASSARARSRHQVVAAFEGEDPDVIVVEGQGALSHPAYLTSTHILRGSRPAGVIVQHAPTRNMLGDFPMVPMPTVGQRDRPDRGVRRHQGHRGHDQPRAHDRRRGHRRDRRLRGRARHPGHRPPDPAAGPLVDMVLAAFPELAAELADRDACERARIEIDLDRHRAQRPDAGRPARRARASRVTGVTKATLGLAEVGRGDARGRGRRRSATRASRTSSALPGRRHRPRRSTLIRSPMLSQVDRVVAAADVSLNTEPEVLAAPVGRGRASRARRTASC